MARIRKRTAALSAVGLTVAGVAIIQIAQPASAVTCPDVEVVFARGSGEAVGPGILGKPFVDQLTSKLQGLTVNSYAVNYAASMDQRSAGPGATDLSRHVIKRAKECSDTSFVLGGYSQGASVVDIAIGAFGRRGGGGTTPSVPGPSSSTSTSETTAPTLETTAPTLETTAPEPTASAPESAASAPEPTASAPEPTASAPEPTASAPEPTASETTSESSTDAPTSDTSGPGNPSPEVTTIPAELRSRIKAVAVFGNPLRMFGMTIERSVPELAGKVFDSCAPGDPICGAGTNFMAHLTYHTNGSVPEGAVATAERIRKGPGSPSTAEPTSSSSPEETTPPTDSPTEPTGGESTEPTASGPPSDEPTISIPTASGPPSHDPRDNPTATGPTVTGPTVTVPTFTAPGPGGPGGPGMPSWPPKRPSGTSGPSDSPNWPTESRWPSQWESMWQSGLKEMPVTNPSS